MLIKDILTIDLSEDIKNVIDLEDISEAAIQSEIENYIITEGLAEEYSDFVSTFTSNIIETGVWISGFYGSGKSYFGKLLGYMISNRLIGGTPARDRILQRFTGINDEALVKNSIAKLNSVNARVVFMDIAKQDTSKGFAYALFRNFLKSLELPENEHGFLLFSLMCSADYSNVVDFVQDKSGKSWSDLKNNRIVYIGKIKEIYIALGNSEADYSTILTTIRREIDEFSASKLKDELSTYFKAVRDEKVVFLFDEASEAINQRKFTLLDLEGLSESLSSLGGKVWTIAIAQEKLDDVINNSNISKAQLTKVTDRFKIKIHLEATEVDVIIRSRLLKKKDDALQKLKDHYQKNSGKIADHSGLTGAGKTENSDSFVTYYPFYQNQFGLLQNFLFGRQGYASTKVAARGMIITTYDILKHEIQNETLFNVATGWQIAKEAQPQPPVRLVNRYSNADTILKNEHIDLPGRHLLETIHFLTEAEVAPTSFTNIVKSYVKAPEDFHTVQALVTKALDTLVEHKILLLSNGTYRITSDIEQRLLDEMNQFLVQIFKKKQQIISAFKNSAFIKSLAKINDANTIFDFYITSDNDDELTNPGLKQLKLKVKSLYSFGDDRSIDIEQLKTQFQNNKDVIWLAPDNSHFREIDKLLEEVERIKYLEEKYTNPNSEEGPIVRAFQSERSAKEIRLKELVEQSLMQGNSIYLYNTAQMDNNNWQNVMNGLQRQVIQNVYYKRLTSQLSDALADRIIREANSQRLQTYFNGQGIDFQFYDAQGNFIGEALKPAEEILFKIRNTFVDGATLEKDLEQPPTGFGFGTVITTVAALMRGGKIMSKYNGAEKFSWRDDGVSSIFSAAREFRKASFKAIAKSLSTAQKNSIVTSLQELESETHTHKKVDWNTNDFDLVNAVRELAKLFCDKVDFMKRSNKDFDALFSNLETCKDQLGVFTGAVSEANYIDKADNYLDQNDIYANAIREIEKAEKFIRNNLDKLRQWKAFADGVNDEINKAAKADVVINPLLKEYNSLYQGEVVKNFKALQETAQKIKDAYYQLMQAAATEMAAKYILLQKDADELIKEIHTLPAGLNEEASLEGSSIRQYASQRTNSAIDIDYDVKDRHTRFTYSEMLSFIQLFHSYKTKLEIIKSGLITTTPTKPAPGTPVTPTKKIYSATLPGGKVKVSEYKTWLQNELQKISGAAADDEVEIKNL
ncbi:BREX system P-loop protein BrxC [Mucilaginibacter segetis]|uniref:BREX system P-loop protein BrxC n=1 Tax=Mucilaginibacter segetis TaxID=2793071 RepID=A0A934PU30_9SPHI|nr:BREX system P-loop protein BrxC [Mucilaginibacter segetis]MBK0380054.1 BREX system P-loop protein BrxC [Mucilaginibacter segetis]